MKNLVLFAASFFLATQFAHAETSQAKTLQCSNGLSVPFKSFYLEMPSVGLGSSASPFVSVTTELPQFLPLFQANATGKHFAECDLQLPGQQAATLKFTEVYVQLVSITSDRDTRYVTATLNFSKIEYLAATGTASASNATALTPEQQSKALADFLSRVPKPSGN